MDAEAAQITTISPDWPAPSQIKAAMTTRLGGVSVGAYQGLNLGSHVGDDQDAVQRNRDILAQTLQLPATPIWLNQQHTNYPIAARDNTADKVADAVYTDQPNMICTAMTADCLPVLISNRQGTEVAAVHAGWRGLADGVIEATVEAMRSQPSDLLLWFGAAIGPEAFEVGRDVIDHFCKLDPKAESAFTPSRFNGDKWYGNLYQLARHRCEQLGIGEAQIYGGGLCTYTDATRFYSYRRDNMTGRMASLIWISNE